MATKMKDRLNKVFSSKATQVEAYINWLIERSTMGDILEFVEVWEKEHENKIDPAQIRKNKS